jgi:hypothetical protein
LFFGTNGLFVIRFEADLGELTVGIGEVVGVDEV